MCFYPFAILFTIRKKFEIEGEETHREKQSQKQEKEKAVIPFSKLRVLPLVSELSAYSSSTDSQVTSFLVRKTCGFTGLPFVEYVSHENVTTSPRFG